MAQSNTTKRTRGQTTAHRAGSGPRTTLMSPVEPVETAAPAMGGVAQASLAPGGLAPGGFSPNGVMPGGFGAGRLALNGLPPGASAPAGLAPTGAPAPASPAISYTTTTPPAAPTPAFTPPPAAPPAQQFRFLMTSQGLPGISRIGAAPSGEVLLTGRPGEGYAVAGTIYGMPPLPDRSLSPTLWLLHDLTVPMDLSPGDLAALPRGNQPGLLFTQDGRPPSFGPQANVITIAVPVGIFQPNPEGGWQAHAQLTPANNQTFHPLAALGPNELPDPNLPMPSGTMAALLTDLFLRQATLLPHLRVREQHPDRLRAICQVWGARPPQYLDGGAFTRVAVTLEGPVRSTPNRLPTQEALILWGNNRAQLS